MFRANGREVFHGLGVRSNPIRIQVPNNHILTSNLHYNHNYYYPKPKYLIIGYMDPLGKGAQDRRQGSEACASGLTVLGTCCGATKFTETYRAPLKGL